MSCILILTLLIQSAIPAWFYPNLPSYPHLISAQEPRPKPASRLSNPLIGDDGRIYICLERNLLVFQSNGTISRTIPLNYTCNVGITPVLGASKKIYLVAENRVLKINTMNTGTPESDGEVLLGPETGAQGMDEIIGLSVSTSSSWVLINIKRRGLFAYRFHGKLRWSTGPVINRMGYRQGCRKNVTDCYFTSVPVIDHCQANIYVSNNQGELYALSMRGPHFKWIQDFSSLDKSFTVTAGNNGQLYVAVSARALILALDVSTGTVLWQQSIGPLKEDSSPVADINGWVSITSLDGLLYSFSPTGALKKFPIADVKDTVAQVNPVLDCSGYAVYISQTKMEGKISHVIGEYTYVSALKPVNAIFTLLVPATGSVYWSKSYPGSLSSLFSESDLRHFVLDERIVLAFLTASNAGNPLSCISPRQKLASSCSLGDTKHVSIYTGDEKAILLFLFLETTLLILLAAVLRFCCEFWRKKKLKDHDLGKFLEKRRSLRLQKKIFDRTITELEKKAAEESTANEVHEKLEDLVRERRGIERKLSTTYSLGRDTADSRPKSLLPLSDGKAKSFSFRSGKKDSVTIFHTLSNTSSEDGSSKEEVAGMSTYTDRTKSKGKAPVEVESSSDNGDYGSGYETSPSASRVFMSPLHIEEARRVDIRDHGENKSLQRGTRSIRRRSFL